MRVIHTLVEFRRTPPRPIGSHLVGNRLEGSLSKLHQRDSVFSQDAIDAQKANQTYRETVEKANVAILEAKKKLEMSRELIEGNELESHDEKIKVMKENQNQGWFLYLIGHSKVLRP